jgi:uncharacterized membrane protein
MTTVLTKVRDSADVYRLSTWAIVGGVCGLLAAIPVGPEFIRAILLLSFIFVGPGSVVLQWSPGLPPIIVRMLVPIIGFCVVSLLLSAGLLSHFYSPRISLLVMAAVTVAVGYFHRTRPDSVEVGA